MKPQTIIIAEAGVNHNGRMDIARQLIDAAVAAGVDYVKFQTFKTEIKRLELDREKHELLIDYCRQKGIRFLSTAFDLDSIDLLEELGIDLYKIPSGEITNLPYLQKIASKGKPVILSTGMANLGEIEAALGVLYTGGIDPAAVTVLHCNTEYPTPLDDVNLRAMHTIAEAFKVPVGYSDHTLGIEVPIAAVARGAVCIEKHFTLDRSMEGPDHRASLEPEELRQMVHSIRNIERALGRGIKQASPSERKNIPIARKSIHLATNLPEGHVLRREDLRMKRPGHEISPMDLDLVLGRRLRRDLETEALLSLNDLA